MENNNIKQKLSNQKGITLISLIITIVVMLIIVGISVNTGTESLDTTRLQGFYTQLDIIQKRVDDIATTNESYVDSNGNTIYLKEQGTDYENMTTTQKNNLQKIIATEGASLNLTISQFRYFTKGQLKTILDLSDMDYNVFVDFNTRTVIAEEGITINGISYYILFNQMYFTEQNAGKNEGTITSLDFDITAYGTKHYKIVVEPSNIVGDLEATGTLKYKKSTTKYWETASGLEIIVSELTQYDILYEDNNKNNISATIKVELNGSGNPTITVV